MTVEEILEEIEWQKNSIQYLREHPNVAEHTIMHETVEYCRGAMSMLNYLKTYIEQFGCGEISTPTNKQKKR